jgi:hypothetical protein
VPDREYVTFREIHGIYRPLIWVSISCRGSCVDLMMLVDTGADNIVLPARFMPMLGVTEAECTRQQANMVFGAREGLVPPITADLTFPDYWNDRSFPAELVFTEALDSRSYGLLGREPTLDHVRLEFGNVEGYGFWLTFPTGR